MAAALKSFAFAITRRTATSLVLCCTLFLVLTAPASRAADLEYKQVLITPTNGAILVRLPLTDVTGKVRVKEKSPDGLGVPVAPTKTPLGAAHYLEWQIGYDRPDTNSPTSVPHIHFVRKGETKYGHELSKLLVEALALGLITTNELQYEIAMLPKLAAKSFEEHETIQVEAAQQPDETGFARAVQRVPQFIKMTDHGAVQIILKPKQRAVGYQAMVYVCLPMEQALNSSGEKRRSGAAKSKETVYYRFDRDNASFFLDIVRAFAMASQQHNEDIGNILRLVLQPVETPGISEQALRKAEH